MKIIISFSTTNAAFEDDMPGEIEFLLDQAHAKLFNQLQRIPECICDHDEADDVLLDTNGNRVGSVVITEEGEDVPQTS
jgi:hypothetical protein